MDREPSVATRYRLNALLASLPDDAKIVLGRQPFQNPAHLEALRDELRDTHFVRRARDGIEAIGYRVDVQVVGERDEVRLISRPDIAQNLLRDWLRRSLIARGLRILPGRGVQYISDRAESNLLLETCRAHGVRLPDGVGRRVAADFEIRRVRGRSGQMRQVVVIDVRTRITIDCTLPVLLNLGLDVLGLYVQREVNTPQGSHRRLAGRVRAIEGPLLTLDDHEPDVPSIAIADAWLEPRQENLEGVLHAIAGPSASKILDDLKGRIAERIRGRARLKAIDRWVESIRKYADDVAQGVRVDFGKSVMRQDAGRFPPCEVYDKPELVFDVGRTKTSVWNQGGLDKFGPYNFERFAPRQLNVAVICQSSRQGDVERFIKQLCNGIPDSKYAETGFVRRYRLDPPTIRIFTSRSPLAKHYREAAAAAIDDATTRNAPWNLALIQTDESFRQFTGDSNPYLVTKALLLTKEVPTQSFEWESIRPGGQIAAVANNIGLAAYAKVKGIPWLLPVHQTVAHELVVGLGSFEAYESRFGSRERYIGVTTVFSADGRYLLESRTPATPADEYLAAMLAALERAISAVRLQQAWTDEQTVRLVFHVFKDFNKTEIAAVKALITKLQLSRVEFAFVHIVEDHPFMLFDPDQDGVGTRTRKGEAAPPRGLRVDLAHNEALVCLKGPKELRQTTDGIPKPFLLRLHKDSTFRDLSYLARQVYDFTCMSWRTLLPSPLPITILYSDLVARNLLLLRDVTGWSPENILGQVGRSLWFL